MQNRFRQRQALYSGIADMPRPEAHEVLQRFEHGFQHKPHLAMLGLMYNLHRLRTHSPRRALPGILSVA